MKWGQNNWVSRQYWLKAGSQEFAMEIRENTNHNILLHYQSHLKLLFISHHYLLELQIESHKPLEYVYHFSTVVKLTNDKCPPGDYPAKE